MKLSRVITYKKFFLGGSVELLRIKSSSRELLRIKKIFLGGSVELLRVK